MNPEIKPNIKKSFLFNLVVVLGLCVLFYMCFFGTLHFLTKHGEEVKVPGVGGKDVNVAVTMLRKMHFDVNVDSTYDPLFKPLVVLKQVPDSGAVVKDGRTIFLTVNMLTPPRIPMPNLVNLSLRSAEMLLRNNKLLLGDTIYKPDIAAGAILEQRYKGQVINPGELIMQGSKVSLVIGNGLGNDEFDVPDVTGGNVEDAMIILNQYNIQPILSVADQLSEIKDTGSAIIVRQDPTALDGTGKVNRIKMGSIITLTIMQNPGPGDLPEQNNTTTNKNVK